jgi:hypothetical protein
MKARLVPVFFRSVNDEFTGQLENLKKLLADEAEILEARQLGDSLPEADAVLFPQLLGDAFKQIQEIKKIDLPLLVITSEFGTVAMWDWEIISFLKSHGKKVLAPYDLALTKTICRALFVKRDMKNSKYLVYQDDPGQGFQAEIFKRFYWWEDSCTNALKEKFGTTIEKRSFKAFGKEAMEIPDREAEAVWDAWKSKINAQGLSQRQIKSAVKIYIAAKKAIEEDPAIKGIGSNCLNESHFSDTTPCLAWSMLLDEKGILWACEADTISLATKHIINKSLGVPLMMSNVYPSLVGMAALKHEKIDKFPDVKDPENCLLIVHCGYLGLVPHCFASQWALKPKVLSIVDDNAVAIDGRLPEGDLTLAKLDLFFQKMMTAKGSLEGYVQYPGSDCRNGGIVRISDGHKLMESFYSHHILLIPGHFEKEFTNLARVFDLELEKF